MKIDLVRATPVPPPIETAHLTLTANELAILFTSLAREAIIFRADAFKESSYGTLKSVSDEDLLSLIRAMHAKFKEALGVR